MKTVDFTFTTVALVNATRQLMLLDLVQLEKTLQANDLVGRTFDPAGYAEVKGQMSHLFAMVNAAKKFQAVLTDSSPELARAFVEVQCPSS